MMIKVSSSHLVLAHVHGLIGHPPSGEPSLRSVCESAPLAQAEGVEVPASFFGLT